MLLHTAFAYVVLLRASLVTATLVTMSEVSVSELAAPGSLIVDLSKSMPGTAKAQIDEATAVYRVRGGTALGVLVIELNGEVRVGSAGLNHEAAPLLSLQVDVTDSSSSTPKLTLQQDILVQDANEAPIVQVRTVRLHSTLPMGTVVSKIIASDPDSDSMRYTVIGGDAAAFLEVNIDTGDLIIRAVPNTAGKTEEDGVFAYSLTVRVSDVLGMQSPPTSLPVKVYNSDSCPRDSQGRICGGLERGACFGRCDCRNGYRGAACSVRDACQALSEGDACTDVITTLPGTCRTGACFTTQDVRIRLILNEDALMNNTTQGTGFSALTEFEKFMVQQTVLDAFADAGLPRELFVVADISNGNNDVIAGSHFDLLVKTTPLADADDVVALLLRDLSGTVASPLGNDPRVRGTKLVAVSPDGSTLLPSFGVNDDTVERDAPKNNTDSKLIAGLSSALGLLALVVVCALVYMCVQMRKNSTEQRQVNAALHMLRLQQARASGGGFTDAQLEAVADALDNVEDSQEPRRYIEARGDRSDNDFEIDLDDDTENPGVRVNNSLLP
ncbi:MAG: hypothetical protein MHM6MM_002432 [Cercozoa sp. M6MM]